MGKRLPPVRFLEETFGFKKIFNVLFVFYILVMSQGIDIPKMALSAPSFDSPPSNDPLWKLPPKGRGFPVRY
jgi:hypothetical protein